MENKDIQYFILLKSLIQDKFLERNSPSTPQISKWKGIDIIYFIEDLRKIARASISEKSFYTYFKNEHLDKIPRIDTLNILSIYCGYQSWHHYKQQEAHHMALKTNVLGEDRPKAENIKPSEEVEKPIMLEITNSLAQEPRPVAEAPFASLKKITTSMPNGLKIGIVSLLVSLSLGLCYKLFLADKQYQYCFIDSDRNKLVDNKLEIKIIRENESPILYRVNANECFKYNTREKHVKMIINSPFYKTDTIYRNLANAPEQESIELKPNDYAIMLYYFSKSIKDLKLKRIQLNKLISDDAQIYQVYDSEYYGLENIDKQKYISLVTLPSTSLENLNVLETKMKNGKIIKIKFKIDQNDPK